MQSTMPNSIALALRHAWPFLVMVVDGEVQADIGPVGVVVSWRSKRLSESSSAAPRSGERPSN